MESDIQKYKKINAIFREVHGLLIGIGPLPGERPLLGWLSDLPSARMTTPGRQLTDGVTV